MTTAIEINQIVDNINVELGNGKYFIEYMHGKPRLYKHLAVGDKWITETKSGPEMKKYLLAFLDGVKAK